MERFAKIAGDTFGRFLGLTTRGFFMAAGAILAAKWFGVLP